MLEIICNNDDRYARDCVRSFVNECVNVNEKIVTHQSKVKIRKTLVWSLFKKWVSLNTEVFNEGCPGRTTFYSVFHSMIPDYCQATKRFDVYEHLTIDIESKPKDFIPSVVPVDDSDVYYVYFIGDINPVLGYLESIKIGHAHDINQRLKTFQTGTSHDLVLMASIKYESKKTAYYAEKALHQKFKQRKGEWFAVTSDLIRFISTL